MEVDFIRRRISELRMQKGVSEYQMSLELGHSRSYIQGITSGRSLPSVQELLYICEYLEISPSAFFDEKETNPILVQKACDFIHDLSDKDLQAILMLLEHVVGLTYPNHSR